MRWIEIIRLRAFDRFKHPLVMELLRQQKTELSATDLTCTVYHHATVDTDVSIHLAWDSDLPEHGKSDQGKRLAYLLCEFGYVDYSVWNEKLSM